MLASFTEIGARLAVLFLWGPVGPNLICIYACTVRRYDTRVFKTKHALETSVTSHTAWLKCPSVSSSKFHCKKKRDLPALQHIQLRAHTITQTRTHHHANTHTPSRKHAHLITVFHVLLPENISVKVKVKLPLLHAMEVQILPFFSSHLNRGDWLSSCTSRFNPAVSPVPFR